jgi:beta-1,4-mannosyltransferase
MCLYLCYALFIAVPTGLKRKSRPDEQQQQQPVLVDCVLVQNPPAMPLLAVVYFFSVCQGFLYRHRPAMVIDWHNLGFTMLSKTPIFASVARVYEQFMAPRATAHLCVTAAMKSFLVQQFGIPAEFVSVLHDCPNAMFQPRSSKDNHELLQRLHGKLCAACPRSWYEHLDPSRQTLFTEIDENGQYTPRPGRPALITSSTSWTPDEDFDPLLVALVRLDQQITEDVDSSLKVFVVVTGKGPRRSYYQQQISLLKLHNVVIETLWLEPGDYPRLLSCSDVGISLHTSTSGIDLPMKILDLFGCQVPVCAINFRCLPELVEDNVNGMIFQSSTELQEQLWGLLSPLDKYPGAWPPHGFGDLAKFSRSLQGRKRWDNEWNEHAKPVILSAVSIAPSK